MIIRQNTLSPSCNFGGAGSPSRNFGLVNVLLACLAGGAYATDGQTLLQAVEQNNLTKVQELLADPHTLVDMSYPPKNNKTVLMIAAQKGYTAIVQEIIKKGANLNLQDTNGKTALELATNNQIRQILDSAGALTGAEVRNRKK